MPKFIISKTPESDAPFVVSLVEEEYGISVRLKQGGSENIRILELHNDGRVVRYLNRVTKFGLRSIMGTIR